MGLALSLGPSLNPKPSFGLGCRVVIKTRHMWVVDDFVQSTLNPKA